MIDRQRWGALVAVRAPEVVPTKDVLPCQLYLLVRHMHIHGKPYDTGIGIAIADGVNLTVGTRRHHFGLAEPEEYDRLVNVADAQRLVVLVQDQNLAAERCRYLLGDYPVIGYRCKPGEYGLLGELLRADMYLVYLPVVS